MAENKISTIINFDISTMLNMFVSWSSAVLEKKEEAKNNLLENNPEANALYTQIWNAAIEIQFHNRQYNDIAVRLTNLITSLEITYHFMGEKYQEQFLDIVPPPPASITRQVIDKDNLH